ncbi:hypothetical protein EW145_g286 [Phellinidium pouzarii]|uniref:Uncharacterized protein n=1 Tax=Phellinidium pouzarii TaxID=167371 RepID=A0A4S4LIY9_9AGAM|nr:hypothetical protein EW145_g286 [Phellinidium pouzarii]
MQMTQILRYAGRQINSENLQLPLPAAHYASLSPITFYSSAEIYAKAKTYVQKQKPGKSQGRDTSQANKNFSQDNLARASFEHQRVLYKAIHDTIEFDKFALPVMYWLASTSLVALTFRAWNTEFIGKRRMNPTILDLGLTNVSCMAFREECYERQIIHSTHIKIEEHHTLQNNAIPYAPFKYGTTETVKKDALGKRLNEFFSAIVSERAFLLVYDAEQTFNALKTLGVDVDSYKTGIKALLTRNEVSQPEVYGMDAPHHHLQENNHDRRRSQPYFHEREPRRHSYHRSRSPPRRPEPYLQRPRSPWSYRNEDAEQPLFYGDNETTTEEGEEDEDVVQRTTEIYVIDVRALFLAFSRLHPHDLKSLPDLAARLGIPVDQTMACSGNECHLLIKAWERMASGKAIDEQYAEHCSLKKQSATQPIFFKKDMFTPKADLNMSTDGMQEEKNVDVDPNDIVVPQVSRQPQACVGGFRPPTDDYDTDDSDY